MPSPQVCLINPPTTDPKERSLYFPMALLTLGGVLKAGGVPTELWDFELYFKKVRNTTERKFRRLLRLGVEGSRAKVFGISAICSNFPMALWIAREIKEIRPEAIVVLGGAQPSSIPQETLTRFPFVDAVAIGEGERTLQEWMKRGLTRESLSEIPGMAVRIGDKIHQSTKRELMENLDDCPMPDFSLADLREYQQFYGGDFRMNVEVGRGCPFHCVFCSTSLMWEKNFRVKSPARIYQEMLALHEAFGFREFDFIHDNFTTSRKFVLEFCDYMEANNEKKLTWLCSSRTDCIDVKRLNRMFDCGLRGVFFGLETGSERMQVVIKKNLDFQHFEPVLLRCNELKLDATTAFILGFPEEEKIDMDQTVLRALHYRHLGTSRIFFSKLTALTGTSLYRDHLGRFEETALPSTISPQHYGLPYVREIIKEHPDLFSSYYHLPHPKFSRDYLSKFVEFAHLLVNGQPALALFLMNRQQITPTRLFELWDPWAESKGLPYFDYRVFSNARFRVAFRHFLDEVIFDEKIPLTPHDPYRPTAMTEATI